LRYEPESAIDDFNSKLGSIQEELREQLLAELTLRVEEGDL
jgi:hypothetical protein